MWSGSKFIITSDCREVKYLGGYRPFRPFGSYAFAEEINGYVNCL